MKYTLSYSKVSSKNSPVKGWSSLNKNVRTIFDPHSQKWSVKFDLKFLFSHRTINHRKICNASLDALMCPLQIINWHWTPVINPSWCECMLYPPSIQCQNYSISHKLETAQPKFLKKLQWENILLHLSANFGLKILNTHHYRNSAIILTSGKSVLNGPANSPVVTHSKIQNRLSSAP